ncbi:DNA mismatch repair protein MutL, partial [Pseudomonas savastanoi pv. glycinea]
MAPASPPDTPAFSNHPSAPLRSRLSAVWRLAVPSFTHMRCTVLLPFELDPEIIHHIIYSQAGSIGKAVIELVMNSVDADATALRLTMTKEGFHCADDGRG